MSDTRSYLAIVAVTGEEGQQYLDGAVFVGEGEDKRDAQRAADELADHLIGGSELFWPGWVDDEEQYMWDPGAIMEWDQHKYYNTAYPIDEPLGEEDPGFVVYVDASLREHFSSRAAAVKWVRKHLGLHSVGRDVEVYDWDGPVDNPCKPCSKKSKRRKVNPAWLRKLGSRKSSGKDAVTRALAASCPPGVVGMANKAAAEAARGVRKGDVQGAHKAYDKRLTALEDEMMELGFYGETINAAERAFEEKFKELTGYDFWSERFARNPRVKNRRRAEPDEQMQRELWLYFATGSEPLYEAAKEFKKMVDKKRKAGKYNSAKALKAFEYLADQAAAEYTRDYRTGGPHGRFGLFSKTDRRAVATLMRDAYEQGILVSNPRRKNPERLTKKQVLADFMENVLPEIERYEAARGVSIDKPLRAKSWNNFVDSLERVGVLPKSNRNWGTPPEILRRRRAKKNPWVEVGGRERYLSKEQLKRYLAKKEKAKKKATRKSRLKGLFGR